MARGNYAKFFELIEATFDVDEITPDKIMQEYYSGSFGNVKAGKNRKGKQRFQKSRATIGGQSVFMNLAERLSEGGEIVRELQNIKTSEGFKEIRSRAGKLEIHSQEVIKRIDVSFEEFKISEKEKAIAEKISLREIRIGELRSQAESEFNQGDLESLIEIRNESRKLKRDYPEEFSEIDSLTRGLRLQLTELRNEEIKIEQQEARERKEELRKNLIEPDF